MSYNQVSEERKAERNGLVACAKMRISDVKTLCLRDNKSVLSNQVVLKWPTENWNDQSLELWEYRTGMGIRNLFSHIFLLSQL